MGLADIARVVRKVLPKREPREELPDGETRDKVLRSLRRQRRTQVEEQEKIHLRKVIAAYQEERDKRFIFGSGEQSIIHEKNVLLGGGRKTRGGDLGFLRPGKLI